MSEKLNDKIKALLTEENVEKYFCVTQSGGKLALITSGDEVWENGILDNFMALNRLKFQTKLKTQRELEILKSQEKESE